MPFYETVLIARQDISAQQVESLIETFAGVITELGGKVTKTENWGLRSLAYRIKKNRKGYYILFNMNTPVDSIKQIEHHMRLDERVLRYLTIKVDKLQEKSSDTVQSRAQG